jgi:hypothetical protein
VCGVIVNDRKEHALMDTINVSGKWSTRAVPVSRLTERQQDKLSTHLRYLAEGQPILEDLGFRLQGETMFVRGQPETEFKFMGAAYVSVYLTGYGHWQVFKNGVQTKGTREVANLAAVVTNAIEGR